jgi:oxygen-independent coproporphyrinogen-3 oxidase
MTPDLLQKYDTRVPRYTSYPTAPHFHGGVDGTVYSAWLTELDADAPLSIYLHIPFCDSLCWFCGCHTAVVNRPQPVSHYLDYLRREIGIVAAHMPGRRRVNHVHLGGGSPTILSPDEMRGLFAYLREHFDFCDDAEIAVEVDPRGFSHEMARALGDVGLTRASIGVQDLDPKVQQAVNRIQPFETTQETVQLLRDQGVKGLNIDLMYGLPHQTVSGTVGTAVRMLNLKPDRLALFGYAHVPWMKKHQRLIPESALPDAAARLEQYDAASTALRASGYVPIGLDHFARPGDPLAVARKEGRLYRNFQGYTTDAAPALLGMGVSAIGKLPTGYVQNAKSMADYVAALDTGMLPVHRGVRLTAEDRLRRAVIDRLMCDLSVDVGEVAEAHGFSPRIFDATLGSLRGMTADGVVRLTGRRLTVPDEMRPLVRSVASVFDAYMSDGEGRHAKAV